MDGVNRAHARVPTVPEPTQERRRVPGRYAGWLLLMPALATLAFYASALFLLFEMSIERSGSGEDSGLWTALVHYKRALTEELYVRTLFVTFKVALYATVLSLLLGYPLAYTIVHTNSRLVRSLLILLVAIPFLTNVVVRLYALSLMLANTGLINTVLQQVGVLDENDILPLIRNEFGVTIGLVYFVLPFVVFTLVGSLQRLDKSLQEAAHSLGASEVVTFFLVTLPLSKAGVIGAGILAFTLTASAFSTPLILGGGKVQMVANTVYDQVLFSGNTPLGAALAVVALVITISILYVQARLSEPRGHARD